MKWLHSITWFHEMAAHCRDLQPGDLARTDQVYTFMRDDHAGNPWGRRVDVPAGSIVVIIENSPVDVMGWPQIFKKRVALREDLHIQFVASYDHLHKLSCLELLALESE